MNARHFSAVLLLASGLSAMGNDLPIDQFINGERDIDGNLLRTNSTAHPNPANGEAASGLVLMLSLGTSGTNFGNVRGWHGGIRSHAGTAVETNRAEVFATDDKTKIVLMVLPDGPLYSSTNSGMNWSVKNTPGKHNFPLTIGSDGGGFYAEGNIAPGHTGRVATNWYATAATPDGAKLILTDDPAQPAPALGLTQTNEALVVSWPAAFSNFHLQSSDDPNAAEWTPVNGSVHSNAEENRVILPPSAASPFYRLRAK